MFVLMVLACGVINLVLGYGVAVLLAWLQAPQATPSTPLLTQEPVPSASPVTNSNSQPDGDIAPESPEPVQQTAESPAEPDAEPSPGPPPVPHKEEIPLAWLELLGPAVQPNSLVEATAEVLKLEVGQYRERLIGLDDAIRLVLHQGGADRIAACVEELQQANRDWLIRQREAAHHLRSRSENPPYLEDAGNRLEVVLLEQAAQIETTSSNLEMLNLSSELAANCRRVVVEINRLIDSCHRLRDSMYELLLAILHHENRLIGLDANLRKDPLTTLINRAGLELTIQQWLRDDPHRRRLLSLAICDLGQMQRINEQFGPRVGDRVIRQTARLLNESLRKNRGYDIVGRLSGQQFLMFLGDTGPRNATSGVERIRQTLREASFLFDTTRVDVFVNCGVAEMRANDTVDTVLAQVRETLIASKTSGQDGTFLYEGSEAIPIEAPKFTVPLHTVRLDYDE